MIKYTSICKLKITSMILFQMKSNRRGPYVHAFAGCDRDPCTNDPEFSPDACELSPKQPPPVSGPCPVASCTTCCPTFSAMLDRLFAVRHGCLISVEGSRWTTILIWPFAGPGIRQDTLPHQIPLGWSGESSLHFGDPWSMRRWHIPSYFSLLTTEKEMNTVRTVAAN